MGPAVMVGKSNGVAALLKKKNPYLISIHCVAHRLALALSQAAVGIKLIVQYQKTLGAIYSHFSHSTIHSQHLTLIQQVLKEPEIKMKKLFEVCWLSFHITVDAVLRSLTSLLVYFDEEDSPIATGIYRSIATYQFLAITHFLKDILSILAKLSEMFQRQKLDISVIQPKVRATNDAICTMRIRNGPCLSTFVKEFDEGKYALYKITASPTEKLLFDKAKREFLVRLE